MMAVRALRSRRTREKKRTVFDVVGVLIQCTQKVRNMMNSNVSRETHHVNICKESVHFWRKWSSCKNMLSYVNSKRHDEVPKRHLLRTNEMNRISRLSRSEKVYVKGTGKMETKVQGDSS